MQGFSTRQELTQALARGPTGRSTFLTGVDGCGASGKSAVAAWIVWAAGGRAAGGSAVVHVDDFYTRGSRGATVTDQPIGSHFDWRRLERQVLAPLARDRPARYQVYDWSRDELGEWAEVSPGGGVVVEGVTATRLELACYFDLTVWVECPREIRLTRGLLRDGESAREQWEIDWMPAEDRYVAEHRPHERAGLVVDGVTFLSEDR